MFQTYVLLGGSGEKRREEALRLRDRRGGKPIDTLLFPKGEDTSIKIEHVREIQQTIVLPPLEGTVKTIVFLEMERASAETQHALLKLLEEPPSFALMILTAAKKETLLPTVLSRATVVKLHQPKGQHDFIKGYTELRDLLASGPGLTFSHGTTFETREQAAVWLQTVLHSLHQQLLHDQTKQVPASQSFVQSIRKITRALNTVQTTNTTPRLLMENLLLDLSISPLT